MIRQILEENGWIRSIIALALVATWVASIFLHISLDDQSMTFVMMAIAYYLARPSQTPSQ